VLSGGVNSLTLPKALIFKGRIGGSAKTEPFQIAHDFVNEL